MPTNPVTEEQQEEAQRLYAKHGNIATAAHELGISRRAFSNRLKGGRSKGAAAYLDELVGDMECRRISPLVDAETGEVKQYWARYHQDDERRAQAQREALESLKEEVPRAKPEKPPQRVTDDLCACYVLSDAHIGMLAFSEETGGDDWDTRIAEDVITRWMYAAIQAAPKAHTGLLLQLGDWLHFDGLDALTPASGNYLDTDTRFQLLVRVSVRVLRRILSLMLRKHQHVHVILADANHDPASSAWMREAFYALFESEPRLTVDTSADTYYAFRWGDVSIFAHHGHKSKLTEISRTFAGKFREMYGNTTYSYAHIGHLHHAASKEDPLMITEQHPTLAAMDAYASKLGCVNKRGAHCITYHKSFGEVGRSTIRPEMLRQS